MSSKALKILTEKYKNNPIILTKITEYIEKQLPKQINAFIDREKRKELLENEMDKYITDFLNSPQTQFFYIQNSNTFIHYDGVNYKKIKEDNIWWIILSDITSKKILLDWKYKVKTKLIKRVKKRKIFRSIPESITIQFVLNFLTPSILNSKDKAKYFLTTLGDNILKKNEKIIHFVEPYCKNFLSYLQDNCYFLFKNIINPIDSFKYRYHDHQYSKCRLLHFNPSVEFDIYWKHILKFNILDIIIVACHYSFRYGSSDKYLQIHHSDIKSHILYLKDRNNETIVSDFIKHYLIKVDNKFTISWNDMYYLWKDYLREYNFPILMFKERFKTLLIENLTYNKDEEQFINVSSKHLKYVSLFCEWWSKNIYDCSNNHYEVSELCFIYNNWLQSKSETKHLTENKIFSIIQYFYPNYKIENAKYILNISCISWNKQEDIMNFVNNLKQQYLTKPINLYNLYELYCKYAKEKSFICTVSKKYFEKTVYYVISQKYITPVK